MLRRFAAACSVASIVLAVAIPFVLWVVRVERPRLWLLTSIWCMAPAVWGLWAMLAPRSWAPERFPICGAILGLIAGVLALFVVRVPMRVFELSLSNLQSALGVLLICAMYYLLWMLVRAVYNALGEKSPAGN